MIISKINSQTGFFKNPYPARPHLQCSVPSFYLACLALLFFVAYVGFGFAFAMFFLCCFRYGLLLRFLIGFFYVRLELLSIAPDGSQGICIFNASPFYFQEFQILFFIIVPS